MTFGRVRRTARARAAHRAMAATSPACPPCPGAAAAPGLKTIALSRRGWRQPRPHRHNTDLCGRSRPARRTGGFMAAIKEAKVPDIGNYKDVPVIEWLVAVGDTVKAEQGLLTLESDKATMEVPAPFAGVVRELKVKVGDAVSEGTIVALIEESGAATAPAPKAEAPKPASAPAPAAAPAPA
ncbi:MAG: hypothetical protein LW860_14060, partial [Xanthomonadaceae bacterium]|nr:hypothetical protein [Xanthomonadaceae bacterium]